MSFVQQAFTDSLQTLETFLKDPAIPAQMDQAIKIFVDSLNNQGKVISCGNGGSLCDAAHFAEELTGRFRKDRRALAALTINDPSHITCVANDFGYEHIFSKFIEAHGRKGDVLLAISTSGTSPNVIKAVEYAKQRQMKVVGLTGKSGGTLKEMADVSIIVPSQVTDRIQEVHIKCIHIFIEGIERALFPDHYAN
jgi:D-sedoheptulose 7-phosphate isomerase